MFGKNFHSKGGSMEKEARQKIKKAKADVRYFARKMAAAEKRMKTAEKNGQEKLAAKAKEHFETWKKRYEKAQKGFEELKAENPTSIKKVATWTGLAAAVTVTAVVAAILYKRNDEEEADAETADADAV
jgi:hypothetical protein